MRRAWKKYGYDGQPPTVSAAEIIKSSKDRELYAVVRTADDLNKMIRQWQRFNEVKRPGSTKPHMLETGEMVPEYFVQERKRWVRQENRKREQVLDELYPSGLFDITSDTSPLYDLAVKASGKNILPISYNEGRENPLERLGKFGRYEDSDASYAIRYVDTLNDLFGDNDIELADVSRILERFVDENPLALRTIFENPKNDDVTAINFIYEQGSPNMTSFENYTIRGREYKGRRQQVIDFWGEMEEMYLE